MIPFLKKNKDGKKPPKPTVPRTAQGSIPFQRMFEDGTCRVRPGYYTRTIQYQDINYQLAQQEDKTAIFEEWCSFLNFFDSSIHFELSFVNTATDSADFEKSIRIPYRQEYAAARSSTLNAHYTSPVVIRSIYDAVEKMGFRSGNILEPSMGVGNFFGMLPDSMADSRLYGAELDSITGRIAKKLYPQADITVAGFETTDRRDFYDLAVGNVPFGQYKVNDKAYNKLGFSIFVLIFWFCDLKPQNLLTLHCLCGKLY